VMVILYLHGIGMKECLIYQIIEKTVIVLAVKQNVPVYYSTFTFDQQLKWINAIEARQHSLYRVSHAKFDTSAKIVRMGYSVVLSEMDVFWYEKIFIRKKIKI
jgi:hypothetical protein